MPAFLMHKGANELSKAALQMSTGTPDDVAWAVSSKGYINKKVWMQVLQHIVAWKKPSSEN
jgi:hypothetical protein